MDDSVLWRCNETELIQLARSQGIGPLKRGLPREVLVGIVSGEVEPSREHLSVTAETRRLLEIFVKKNWTRVVSQLPGCDGRCRTFPCSEARHVQCFDNSKNEV